MQITLKPGNQTFDAQAQESILDAALREGYRLPYGCRNGACGSCKGKVVSGEVDHGKLGQSTLSETERAQGYALLCQAEARSDLVIECRDVTTAADFPVKILPSRVQHMALVAPDVMQIQLRLPANERLQFRAGQYIDILLKDGSRRSLSLAHAPHDDALLELHLRNYGGTFSNYVFNSLKIKDILRFEGPLGGFYLRTQDTLNEALSDTRPVILVAGGTGFAPIKSIIQDALHRQLPRTFILYRGARARADLYLDDLPQSWAREHGIDYIPVLSEPLASDQWSGRTGLVHSAVIADHSDLSGHVVYACGAPAMVAAAQRDFSQHCGLPESAFFADAFTPANP